MLHTSAAMKTTQWAALLAVLLTCAGSSGCSIDGPAAGPSGEGGGANTTGSGGTVLVALPLPAQQHSHGDPSALEQDMLEALQQARMFPQLQGPYLVDHPEAQQGINQYSIDTDQVVADFASYPAVPPLAFDPKLAEAALFHSQDMATNGFQGHDGTNGDKLADRVKAAGYSYTSVAENVFSYAQSVDHAHVAFQIDWGNPDLGHRIAIMDLKKRRRHVGISIVEQPPHPDVGPLVVTQDFGMPQADEIRYLVGVAYLDSNNNSQYDPGEGREGLRVVPDKGDFYAITSNSGGYAIPVAPTAGALTVQLQSSASEAIAETSTSVQGENVKVDFALAATDL